MCHFSLALHFFSLSLSLSVRLSLSVKVVLGQVFFWEYFSFNQSVSFHQCSIHIFMYMLVLDKVRSLGTLQKVRSFKNRGALNRQVLYFHVLV
jgi:hypothetical protein